MIAARVASELSDMNDVEVETVRGGLGELSVYIDDQKVVDTNRLWYPRPSTLVKSVRALLTE